MIADRPLRNRLAVAARERAEKYFTSERMVEVYLGAVDEILESRTSKSI